MSGSLFSANSRSPTKSRSAYMVHYDDCFDQVFTTTMMSFYVKIIPLVCDGHSTYIGWYCFISVLAFMRFLINFKVDPGHSNKIFFILPNEATGFLSVVFT